MIEEGKLGLSSAGKIRDASALFLAKLLTRPDLVNTELPNFLKWCVEKNEDSKTDQFLVSIFIFLKEFILFFLKLIYFNFFLILFFQKN